MSSALLIEEEFVSVYPSLVRALGGRMEDAAVVQHLHFWLRVSTNVHDGHRWVYNTYDDWSEKLGVTPDVARRAIQRLQKAGVIVFSTPNARRGDQTKWYRIDYECDVLNPALDKQLAPGEMADETSLDMEGGAGETASSTAGETASSTSTQQELPARTTATPAAPSSRPSTIAAPDEEDVTPTATAPQCPSPQEAAAPPSPAVPVQAAAKKVVKKKTTKKQYKPTFDEAEMCELLADLYEAKGNTRPKLTPTAYLEMHHLLCTDGPGDQKGWPKERVETIIRWAMQDWSWGSRIDTVNALRRNFDKLREDRNKTIAGTRTDPATWQGRSAAKDQGRSILEEMEAEFAREG